METIKLTTVHGYVAEITRTLQYSQFKSIQQVIQSKMVVDPTTQKVDGLKGDVLIEANEKALAVLLVKLTGPDGVEISNPSQGINELPFEDGIEINDKVQEVWTLAMTPKKKATE